MSLHTDTFHIPEGCSASFAVTVTDHECEPYIPRGGTALFERGAPIRDGDVGLFFDGHEAVIRQYCEDWAGNAYLFTLNRRKKDRDIFLPASERRPVCCFGRLVLDKPIPLPEP